jgi:hypothetical protein
MKNDGISRRQFNQLFAAIFAMLVGVKVEAKPEPVPKDNTSYWPDRILPIDGHPEWNVWEQAFAAIWERENKEQPGINYGMGLLQDLMIGTHKYEFRWEGDFDPWLSDRERKICATLIQWLGTNCGRSFLHEVQREATRRAGDKKGEIA